MKVKAKRLGYSRRPAERGSSKYAVGMREVRASSFEEIIFTWLRSEWSRLDCGTPSDRAIIDNANLDDDEENARRKWLLRHRNIILDEIPPGAPAYRVLVEEVDLPNLYIIPTADWYLDTGGSFRVIDTPANLRPARSADPALRLGPIEHYDKVRVISQYMSTYGTALGEALILISPTAAGPYTIIDGTHRAAALYDNHLSKPNMPWEGILIRDPLIEQSTWFMNSKVRQSFIAQFYILASQQLLR
jgi:hypothetical protein